MLVFPVNVAVLDFRHVSLWLGYRCRCIQTKIIKNVCVTGSAVNAANTYVFQMKGKMSFPVNISKLST